jgi:hypothetical protein
VLPIRQGGWELEYLRGTLDVVPADDLGDEGSRTELRQIPQKTSTESTLRCASQSGCFGRQLLILQVKLLQLRQNLLVVVQNLLHLLVVHVCMVYLEKLRHEPSMVVRVDVPQAQHDHQERNQRKPGPRHSATPHNCKLASTRSESDPT